MARSKSLHAVYPHVELSFQSSTLMKVCIAICTTPNRHVVLLCTGAILDIQFSTFYFPPPEGYDRILLEKSLI